MATPEGKAKDVVRRVLKAQGDNLPDKYIKVYGFAIAFVVGMIIGSIVAVA